MTAVQTANSKSNKSAAKAKAPTKRTNPKAKSPVQPPAAEMQQIEQTEQATSETATAQTATELQDPMVPAVVPFDDGVALAGPMARKEIASHLAEVAEQSGVETEVGEDGVVMAREERTGEDRRQGERRHSPMSAMEQFVGQQLNGTQTEANSSEQPGNNGSDEEKAETETNQQVAADAAAGNTAEAQNLPEGFLEELRKLNEKFGITVAPVMPSGITAGRPGRDTKNNITRPAPGTKTGFIWEKADQITMANKGQPCSVDQLRTHPEVRHFNDHTIRTQYARWRQYNGVKGRVTAPQAVQQAQQAPQAPLHAPQAQTGGNTLVRTAGGAQVLVPMDQAPEPMDDQVYQNLLNMKRNNTLPNSMVSLLDAETARRDAIGKENNQP